MQQQIGAFVLGESPGKSKGENIGIESLDRLTFLYVVKAASAMLSDKTLTQKLNQTTAVSATGFRR